MLKKNTYFFILTIFLGAFLIFQVQPIISKFILPWFGGTPSVWTICMLFFQAFLFVGYLYAHLITTKSRPLVQFFVHGSLLLIAAILVLFRTILPGAMKPGLDADPVPTILFILLVTIGLPYFTLAATSPLLQSWYGRLQTGKEPYILYSVSNIGSLLALVSYPVVIEPLLPLRMQSRIWCVCFTCFAITCGIAAWLSARQGKAGNGINENDGLPAGFSRKNNSIKILKKSWSTQTVLKAGLFEHISWIVLPMLSCMLLLAVTNQLCTDVTSGPFLWVLPLIIYLLTFIITFTGWRFVYNRLLFFCILTAGFIMIPIMLLHPREFPFLLQILIYSMILYFGCTACHGELYRLRPQKNELTKYYLFISAGGAFGGILVGLAAPVVFNHYYELPLTGFTILVLIIVYAYKDKNFMPGSQKRNYRRPLVFTLSALLTGVVFAGFLFQVIFKLDMNHEFRRNFFGVVFVQDYSAKESDNQGFRLIHGNTIHGLQLTNDNLKDLPTSYYSHESGIGLVLMKYPHTGSLRVGGIGMGIGTIAAYALPGDEYRFFEINPDVISLARDDRYFHYIKDAEKRGAVINIIQGDGRLSLEQEAAAAKGPSYDVIVLDAFSSDAIPMHLLTKEAFATYFRLLKKDGVIAVHITNQNLDLYPVIAAIADVYGVHAILQSNLTNPKLEVFYAQWILLTNNPYFVEKYYIKISEERRILWTDDFSNLWSVMR